MKKNKFFAGKKPAQAMVEFAIALPLLLLLLYGILEAGRLLFVYSTVVTASRQAVRYGSTTGQGDGGHPRYQDCKGIRDTATKVGFLGPFDSIDIDFDTGPGTTPNTAFCPNLQPSDSNLNTDILETNRARLVVTVNETFHPLVKLVPFFDRTISATSRRTILYSVPIVVEQEQQNWFKTPTTLTITADTPDPSEVNGSVTVSILLVDDAGNGVPNAAVEISGADVNCQITTNNNGIGSCPVVFSTVGAKVITAIYNGDDTYLGISASTDHTVTLIQTKTWIRSDNPDPSIKNQQFVVFVEVTASQKPTGKVDVDGGQGVKCTITLANGTGNCTLSYNNAGGKTLTATYVPDNPIFDAGVPVTDTHTVIEFTPTPTWTPIPPTPTVVPTKTSTPTPVYTPTQIPTAVTSCNLVTHSNITYSGNTMSITISNPYPYTIVMSDITATWNNDKGHKTGNDKSLALQQVNIGTTTVWTGNETSDTKTVPTTATLPPGVTTITFTFQQSYDNTDTSERVYINLLTPGCTGNPIDSKN
jgi:hypothetical protein